MPGHAGALCGGVLGGRRRAYGPGRGFGNLRPRRVPGGVPLLGGRGRRPQRPAAGGRQRAGSRRRSWWPAPGFRFPPRWRPRRLPPSRPSPSPRPGMATATAMTSQRRRRSQRLRPGTATATVTTPGRRLHRPRPRRSTPRAPRWAAAPTSSSPETRFTAVAARAGLSMAQLAATNGLDPNGVLLAGSVLRLSGSGATIPVSSQTSAASAATQPVGTAAQGSAVSPPYPTPGVRQPLGGRVDRRRQRRPGVAGRCDRLPGERVQQRPRLQRGRSRRDADPSRHLGLDPANAGSGRLPAGCRPRPPTTSGAESCCSARC